MNETTHEFDYVDAISIPDMAEQERMVEALLFASSDPMTVRDIEKRLPEGCDVGAALAALRDRYASRGVHVVRAGDGWALRTASDLGFLMSREVVAPRKLSRAALETLSIIAYHQPVTRAEIEEIRGVSVSPGTVDLLIEMGWVRLGRRRLSPGRPMTLVVTPAFLDHFGLGSENDLPGLAELRASGLLDNRPGPEGALSAIGESDEVDGEEEDPPAAENGRDLFC